MSDAPESIILMRLPPHHVLHLLLVSSKYFVLESVCGLDGSVVANVDDTYAGCYCRIEDFPAEYGNQEGPASTKELQIREGVRYVRRDGKVTGPATPKDQCGIYRWMIDGNYYTDDGVYNTSQPNNPYDLDSEFVETADIGRTNWGPRDTSKPQPDTASELRQQCQRQAERIEELERALGKAKADLEWVGKDLSDGINYQKQKLAEMTSERDALKARLRSQMESWSEVVQTLDQCCGDWHPHNCGSSMLGSACKAIRNMADLIRTKDRLIEAHREVLDEVEKERDQLKAELATRPAALRWERRKPTEEECRNERYLTRWNGVGELFWQPREANHDDFEPRGAEVCILPEIMPAAESPKTITQRRWLVCEDGEWTEVWTRNGENPIGVYDEMIETDKTQEVTE